MKPITYLLRNVPAPIWRKAQAKAKAEGVSIRVVLLRLIADYARSES